MVAPEGEPPPKNAGETARMNVSMGSACDGGSAANSLHGKRPPDQAARHQEFATRVAATGSDVLRHQLPRPCVRLRLDIDRPQVGVVDVLQGHGHDPGLPVDIDAAEEL